jgi:acetyl-CoA acyltransferase
MNKQLQDAYIVSAVRTPTGKAFRGMFRSVRPDDLLVSVLKGLLDKTPNLDPETIDDVIIGCGTPEAEQGWDVARRALLLAGYPVSVPGVTINRFCSSGLQSVAMAADRIRVGEADVVIGGGVDSMSVVPSSGWKPSYNPDVFHQENTIGITYSMGIGAELIAREREIGREAQDQFALKSHIKALEAIQKGEFKDEILPFEIVQSIPGKKDNHVRIVKRTVDTDEGPRADTSIEVLRKLRPVFDSKGTVTAGNSSQMSDGAAAILLCSEKGLKKHNLNPLARFVSYAVEGVKPEYYTIGPVKAIPKALQYAGITLTDIGWFELNEAFAAQILAVIRELDLDLKKINPCGGAIALGHPIGATGAKLTATLVHAMNRHRIEYGMVSMCIGFGMGAAGVFELIS